ncbi:MAG: carbohydrate binding domain-containing protein, partial [Prevotella sp.]|nr:carbohydrate binding domain-containing protein [Prevotella sp.]
MKKRLLLSFAAVIGAMTSFAYNVGDYVYTNTAKFKVIGENILTNGNFAANYDGWKDYADGSLSPDYWSIEAGASEDGGNVIQCTNGAADLTGNYMYQAVPYESGRSYIITFKVKGVDPVTSSITPQTTNYIDVYANADGTLNKTADNFCQVATTDAVTAEWTSYSYSFTDTITGGSTGYIVVTFGQLTAGTQVSDVEVREVTEVFDTRISDREFAYAEALLAIDGMVNGRDELQGTLESIKEGFFMSPESEDPTAAQDALNSFIAAETEFLNANSYDLTSQIDGKTIWTTKVQKAGDGKQYGDWYLDGDARWFHDPATDPSIRHFIQGTYNLSAGTAKIVKMLPPGKYFFSCESKGHRMAGSAANVRYEPDYSYVVEGAAVFIGNDSVKFNLDQRNFERHFVVADVAEGETLNAGFWHPATSVDNKLGGTVYMQAPVLRIIGDNSDGQMEAYIVNYATLKEIAVQANSLRVMLDSAITVKAKAEFPWGKDALQESITYYEGTYSSLSVKQPGQDLFAEAADSLMQSMRLVRTAIQDYYALNAPYTDLKAQLVIANESYNNPQNAAGDKATFLAVINKAQALVDGVTAEYSEEVANNMIAAKAELVEAQFAFEASTASLANPSEIEIVNPYFAQFTNQSNVEGWTMTGQTDNGRWKKGTLSVYENA